MCRCPYIFVLSKSFFELESMDVTAISPCAKAQPAKAAPCAPRKLCRMDALADSLTRRLGVDQPATAAENGVDPPSPMTLLDEDTLTGILSKASFIGVKKRSDLVISVEALMRIVPVSTQFQTIARRLVSQDQINGAKTTKMMHLIMPSLLASLHPWTVDQAAMEIPSKMELARYVLDHADLVWLEAGPHACTLGGSLAAVEKRIQKKKVSKAAIVEAYSDFIATTAFDPVPLLDDHGFMNPSSAGLFAPATLRAILTFATSGAHEAQIGAHDAQMTSLITRANGIDLFLSKDPEKTKAQAQCRLLNTAFDFCASHKWPKTLFRRTLYSLVWNPKTGTGFHRDPSGLIDVETYRQWIAETLIATSPRIAFKVDPTKGSRWMNVPANVVKAQEVTEKNLAVAKREVPTDFPMTVYDLTELLHGR